VKVGVAIGVVIGLLIGASAAFATTNFMNYDKWGGKTPEYQRAYVQGVADMIWLVKDTGNQYVTDAVNCLDRHSDWGSEDVYNAVSRHVTTVSQNFTMASIVSVAIENACK